MLLSVRLAVAVLLLVFVVSTSLPLFASNIARAADLSVDAHLAETTVPLGGTLAVIVTVTNQGDAPVEVPGIDFGRGSLVFDMELGGGVREEPIAFRATRILGSVYRPETPAPVSIPAGESLEATVRLPAIVPGTARLTGILWEQTELPTLEATVQGDRTDLRLVMDWKGTGTIRAELFPDIAPNTVLNFAKLAQEGFFAGVPSHRIIKGFMIQAGDPTGTGTGGPGFSIPAEFNQKHHAPGVLSMARSQHEDSAGSQFFIMHGDVAQLDGQYTVFGRVVEGMDIVEILANTPVTRSPQGERSAPVEKPVIAAMRLETVPAGEATE